MSHLHVLLSSIGRNLPVDNLATIVTLKANTVSLNTDNGRWYTNSELES